MAQSSSDKSLISNRYEVEKVGAGVEVTNLRVDRRGGGGAESSAACSHHLRQLVGCE